MNEIYVRSGLAVLGAALFGFGYALKSYQSTAPSVDDDIALRSLAPNLDDAQSEPSSKVEGIIREIPVETRGSVESETERAVAALDWLFGDGAPSDPGRGSAMSMVMAHWVERDLDGAIAWLRENLKHPGADHYVSGLVHVLSESDPESALEWSERIEHPGLKMNSWSNASLPILVTDPNRAEELLGKSGLSSDARDGVRSLWVRRVKGTTRTPCALSRATGGRPHCGDAGQAAFPLKELRSLLRSPWKRSSFMKALLD
jgi:hypothetical protein